jgi:hypothetical protein
MDRLRLLRLGRLDQLGGRRAAPRRRDRCSRRATRDAGQRTRSPRARARQAPTVQARDHPGLCASPTSDLRARVGGCMSRRGTPARFTPSGVNPDMCGVPRRQRHVWMLGKIAAVASRDSACTTIHATRPFATRSTRSCDTRRFSPSGDPVDGAHDRPHTRQAQGIRPPWPQGPPLGEVGPVREARAIALELFLDARDGQRAALRLVGGSHLQRSPARLGRDRSPLLQVGLELLLELLFRAGRIRGKVADRSLGEGRGSRARACSRA